MNDLKQIRIAVGIVIFGLVISGHYQPELHTGLVHWILTVREGLEVTYQKYPFIAYGTDWLAFAHLMIALFFILPWQDPVRYEGVLKVGVAASLGVIPLAFICGPLRGIPLGWRIIDCSFGLLCLPPLLFALRKVRALAD